MVSGSTAQLVAVFVECVFYGVYLVTFFASLWTLLWSGPRRTLVQALHDHGIMFIVVMSMFTFSTLNLALGLVRIVQGYEFQDITGSGARLGALWIDILKLLCVYFQTMIADAVVTYRCWIVLAKSSRMIMPSIFLSIGTLICTIAAVYIEVTLPLDSPSRLNGEAVFPVFIAFWCSTILLNIYTTTIIVLRIWRVIRIGTAGEQVFSLNTTRDKLQIVLRIIIESALMYTVATISVFVTQVFRSNSTYITSAAEL